MSESNALALEDSLTRLKATGAEEASGARNRLTEAAHSHDESNAPPVDNEKRQRAMGWFKDQTAQHKGLSDKERNDLNALKLDFVDGDLPAVERYFREHKEDLPGNNKHSDSSAAKVVNYLASDLSEITGIDHKDHKIGPLERCSMLAESVPRPHNLDGSYPNRFLAIQNVDDRHAPNRFYNFTITPVGTVVQSNDNFSRGWTAHDAMTMKGFESPNRLFQWSSYWMVENMNRSLDKELYPSRSAMK